MAKVREKSYLTRRGVTEIGGMVINKPNPYSKELMRNAIKYGMVLLIRYKGADDDLRYGRERVIWPMIMGTSKDGNPLLRGFQTMGWSVSAGGKISKEWRMFRCDRIISMTFTGNFFQTAPSGYDMDDDSISNIEYRAIMDNVVKNQRELLSDAKIYDIEERTIRSAEENAKAKRKEERTIDETAKVEAEDVSQQLNLEDPYSQDLFSQNDSFVGVFLSPLDNSKQKILLIGATGKVGVELDLTVNNFLLGRYVIVDTLDHLSLTKIPDIDGETVFDMYLFEKRIS